MQKVKWWWPCLEGGEMGSCNSVGTEFLSCKIKKFCGWKLVMAAQLCGRTQPDGTVHGEAVKTVSFTYVFIFFFNNS